MANIIRRDSFARRATTFTTSPENSLRDRAARREFWVTDADNAAQAAVQVRDQAAGSFHPNDINLPLRTVRATRWSDRIYRCVAYYRRRQGGTTQPGEIPDTGRTKARTAYVGVEWFSTPYSTPGNIEKLDSYDEITGRPNGIIHLTANPTNESVRPIPWIWKAPVIEVLVQRTFDSSPLLAVLPFLHRTNFVRKTFDGLEFEVNTVLFDGVAVTEFPENFLVQYSFILREDGWGKEIVTFQGADLQNASSQKAWRAKVVDMYPRADWGNVFDTGLA